jgi:solute carrier family 13 (sodium-dependent dicarboxylate transporter), member 2/3/5
MGLVLGPLLFFIIVSLPIDNDNSLDRAQTENNIASETGSSDSAGNIGSKAALSFQAKLVLAITFWMATWWITEAIPIYVTALLPLILFPSLGLTELGQTAANYADRIIFLFLGGFILAKAVEKTNLHKRFALNILKVFGTTPKYIVAAFILVTGILSAWMSNTATAMLMLPIAGAVISQIGIGNRQERQAKDDKKKEKDDTDDSSKFGLCLMLSIAYSASIGGMATLIGTPPNAIFASLSKSMLDLDISFGEWLLIGLPISGISLVVIWIYMVNVGAKITHMKSISGGKEIIRKNLGEIGSITRDEKIVGCVFAATATAWITRGLIWGDLLPAIDDSTIAIAAALTLFLLPSKPRNDDKTNTSIASASNSRDNSPFSFLSSFFSHFFPKKDSRTSIKNNIHHVGTNENIQRVNSTNGPEDVEKHKTKKIDDINEVGFDSIDEDEEEEKNDKKIMDWKTAVTIPWGVLLLIGGGLALANGFITTGLDEWISNQLVFVENLTYLLIVLVIVIVAVLASEIISNTATAALLIPITVSLASAVSIDPLLLMVPLTIATSYGFVMPVGTPPNAIVFGSKYVTAPKMARAGFPLDIIGILIVTALTTLMVPLVWK